MVELSPKAMFPSYLGELKLQAVEEKAWGPLGPANPIIEVLGEPPSAAKLSIPAYVEAPFDIPPVLLHHNQPGNWIESLKFETGEWTRREDGTFLFTATQEVSSSLSESLQDDCASFLLAMMWAVPNSPDAAVVMGGNLLDVAAKLAES